PTLLSIRSFCARPPRPVTASAPPLPNASRRRRTNTPFSLTSSASDMRRFNSSARHAQLVLQFEFPPKLAAFDVAPQERGITRDGAGGFFAGFIDKFNSKPRHPERHQPRRVLRARLRPRVEQGVPATCVRLERMLHAHAVADFDTMFVARPAAIGIVGSGAEKRAKHAMLHV